MTTPTDTLGDHLKDIEHCWTFQKLDKSKFSYARLDGRAFHTLTKRAMKPFDSGFSEAMVESTERLIKDFSCDIAFVQSDEISLGWFPKSELTSLPFDGKEHKLTSVMASSCSVNFMNAYGTIHILPTFDCRVMNLAEEDFWKMFYWRFLDARKNSVTMVAQSMFSEKILYGKNRHERQMLVEEKIGESLDSAYPAKYLYGSLIVPTMVTRPLTEAEQAVIPDMYQTGTITRKDNIFYHKNHDNLQSFLTFVQEVTKLNTDRSCVSDGLDLAS
jgi:tRNA(His) 5'-end guanylyltransferase